MIETGMIDIISRNGVTTVTVEIVNDKKEKIGQATLQLDKFNKKVVEGFEKVVKIIIKG